MVVSDALTSRGQLTAESAIDAKVMFLSQAEHYPEGTSRVETVETHMSWVFLTDRFAYKLKKPVRNGNVDLRTLAARQSNCADEIRLNRRLSTDVYLGTVALRSGADGRLTLRAEGVVVDWLVQMRRLPANDMLDQRIRHGSISHADVDAVIKRLCDYYRQCPPLGVLAAEYRRQFREDIVANRVALSGPDRSMSRRLVEDACAGQLAFLARSSASLDARVHAGRIVEGHGDLRPEHICLEVAAADHRLPRILTRVAHARRCRRAGIPGARMRATGGACASQADSRLVLRTKR